jgi:hypothetical protein
MVQLSNLRNLVIQFSMSVILILNNITAVRAVEGSTGFADKMAAGRADVVLAVAGDSTGNEEWEWVYQTAAALGEKFDYNVDYYLYDKDLNGYRQAQRIHDSSRARKLIVYNCSIPGSSEAFLQTEGRSIGGIFKAPPDLFIINYGYNAQGDVRYGDELNKVIEAVLYFYPKTQVAVTIQAPKAAGGHDSLGSSLRGDSLRLLASQRKYETVDVARIFSGQLDLIAEDKIHPNKKGQLLWTAAALRAITGQD